MMTKEEYAKYYEDKFGGVKVKVLDKWVDGKVSVDLKGKTGEVVGASGIYNGTWRVKIDNVMYHVHDTYLNDLNGNWLPALP